MNFPLYRVAVLNWFAMEKLVATALSLRQHVFHPEMVRMCTDLMDGLFEAKLDLKA